MKFVRFAFLAGRNTTNEELESMLESDNPAIFTSGVSLTKNKKAKHKECSGGAPVSHCFLNFVPS